MALVDDLRTIAAHLDTSLQPSANEVAPLLGALIAYTEHGDKIVKAAGSEDGTTAVSELLSPAPEPEPEPEPEPKSGGKAEKAEKK